MSDYRYKLEFVKQQVNYLLLHKYSFASEVLFVLYFLNLVQGPVILAGSLYNCNAIHIIKRPSKATLFLG